MGVYSKNNGWRRAACKARAYTNERGRRGRGARARYKAVVNGCVATRSVAGSQLHTRVWGGEADWLVPPIGWTASLAIGTVITHQARCVPMRTLAEITSPGPNAGTGNRWRRGTPPPNFRGTTDGRTGQLEMAGLRCTGALRARLRLDMSRGGTRHGRRHTTRSPRRRQNGAHDARGPKETERDVTDRRWARVVISALYTHSCFVFIAVRD